MSLDVNYATADALKTEVDTLYRIARGNGYRDCEEILARADTLWNLAKSLERDVHREETPSRIGRVA